MNQPTLAGFTDFIRNVMGISTGVLPDNSPVIPMAYNVAIELVLLAIQCASPLMYTLAVYNLGGNNVINYAQDVPDAPVVAGSSPPAPYFENLRNTWNINGFVSGVIQSAADESTSESLVVQEAAKMFTLSDLQDLKTPWGRTYLGIAQKYGNIWGLS